MAIVGADSEARTEPRSRQPSLAVNSRCDSGAIATN